MIDLEEILLFALEDFGRDAAIFGRPAGLRIILQTAVADDLSGMMIDHTGPVGIAAKAEAEAVGLETGDQLTVDNTDYLVQAIHADGLGGVVLRLSVRP